MLTTTVGHGIQSLRDHIERDKNASGDPGPLPSPSRYSDLEANLLTVVNSELKVLETEGSLAGFAWSRGSAAWDGRDQEIDRLPKKLISESVARAHLAEINGVKPEDVTPHQIRDLIAEYALHYGGVGLVDQSPIVASNSETSSSREISRASASQDSVAPTSDLPDQVKHSGMGPINWSEVEFRFLSDERVQVTVGVSAETRNYAELNFVDGRNDKPDIAWSLLRELAVGNGIIPNAGNTGKKWPSVEKAVQKLRKTLRSQFECSGDPIPFVSGVGYCAQFKVSCAPSFHT